MAPLKSVSKFQHPLCAFVAALAFSVPAPGAQAGQSTINPKNLNVLGFTLGENEVGDLERKLGKAQVSRAPEHAMTQRCYESKGADHTVLVFEDWSGTLSGFRIYRSAKNDPLCKRTPLIMAEIATASGLKLGLSREKVLRILGKPARTTGNRFVYISDFYRPRTPEEITQFKAAYPGEDVLDIRSYTQITLSFRNSRLSCIDVSHTETT